MGPMSRRDDARKLRWGALLALALLVGPAAITLLHGESDPTSNVVYPEAADSALLGGGTEVSLDSAIRSLPVPVFRPSTALASDLNLQATWIREEPPQALLQYSNGIILTVRPVSEGPVTEAHADAQMKDGVPGAIVDVNGVKAFEVPPSDLGDLGSVRFVMGGAIVTLVGNGALPLDTLHEIAESIIANADHVSSEKAESITG